MSYSTSTPPALMVDRVGDTGAIWWYRSADPIATVMGDNYFSNATDLGMVVGDIVFVVNTTSSLTSITQVEEVTGGAGTVIALTAAST